MRDSGWTLVGTTRSGLDVYQSLPGRDPIPIQTDPELVRRRFFGREVAPSLFAALLVLALLLLTVSIFLPLERTCGSCPPTGSCCGRLLLW